MSNIKNWYVYSLNLLNKINKNINKKYINNLDKSFILDKLEFYIEYCKYNNIKIRRERIELIIQYELYKFSGIIDKNLPKNNHKRIAKFLNIFFIDEKHIYRQFLNEIKHKK